MSEQTTPDILDQDYLFIIGAPRSGTTWLQWMIGSHPQVCTSAELTLFSAYIKPWFDRWHGQKQATEAEDRVTYGLYYVWPQDEFEGWLRQFIAETYRRVRAAKPDATCILDKHPTDSTAVDVIHHFLPQARFIHIIRDGRDASLSMLDAGAKVGFRSGQQWAPAASHWNRMARAAFDARQYADQYLEIRYEDLLADPHAVMRRVFDFAALPITDDELAQIIAEHRIDVLKERRASAAVAGLVVPEGHYNKGVAGRWRDAMTDEDCVVFEDLAGELLAELGYADDEWRARVARGRAARAAADTAAADAAAYRPLHWRIIRAAKVLLGPANTRRVMRLLGRES